MIVKVPFIGGPYDGLEIVGPGDSLPGVVTFEKRELSLHDPDTITYIHEFYDADEDKAVLPFAERYVTEEEFERIVPEPTEPGSTAD